MNKLFVDNNKICVILIFSLIAISFTQFRFFGLPVGIGEMGMLLLGGVCLKSIIVNTFNYKAIYKNIFMLFWFISFLLLCIAHFWVEISGVHSSNTNVIHDTLAYIFVLYILIIFIVLQNNFKVDYEHIIQNFIYFTILLYVLIFIITIAFGDLLGFTERYDSMKRFVGLSTNPNQLALVFTTIPFILISFYNKNNIIFDRSYILPLILLSFILAYYTQSRAVVVVGYLISTTMIAYYFLYIRYKLMTNLALIICVVLGIFYFNDLILTIFRNGPGSYTHRLELWVNALELIKDSPLIGFGPGAHIPSSLDKSHYWEVHNVFLDFLLQTGIIGLSLYLYLLYKIMRNLIKCGNIYLIAAFVSLILFSSFHFVLRQPIFWFYLFYFYNIGKKNKCVV